MLKLKNMNNKIPLLSLAVLSIIFSSCGKNIDIYDFIDKETGEIIHKYNVDIPTIAHRGFHLLDIENTEKAFQAAANRHFIGIETDIHWSKDNHIVINHDDYLNGMNKMIKESNYDELKNHNISNTSSPIYICEFETYLNICKDYNKAPVVEIKSTPNFSQCMDLINIINNVYDDDNGVNNCIFISFNLDQIKYMREIKITNDYKYDVYLLGSSSEVVDVAINEDINASILHSVINEEVANKMHDNNLKLATWTVNDINDVDRLIKLGVTTITSDYIECDIKYCK